MPPLILTALLESEAQARFDQLRRGHFPRERNHLDAHLTLFHQLPGDEEHAVTSAAAAVADRPPITARVDRVREWRTGVAYALTAPDLTALRGQLARTWDDWLSGQDRAKSDLHITVQNKVAPDVALRLHAQLSAEFAPHDVQVVGLGLWRYLGGPWEPVRRFLFRPVATP